MRNNVQPYVANLNVRTVNTNFVGTAFPVLARIMTYTFKEDCLITAFFLSSALLNNSATVHQGVALTRNNDNDTMQFIGDTNIILSHWANAAQANPAVVTGKSGVCFELGQYMEVNSGTVISMFGSSDAADATSVIIAQATIIYIRRDDYDKAYPKNPRIMNVFQQA